MKIKHISSLFVILLTFCVNSQEIDPVSWQKQHPEISIIQSENLKDFSTEELNLLNGKYIVINDELTISDIQSFENSQIKSGSVKPDEISNPKDQQFIKDWLSANNTVKIIRNSEYQSSSENIQNEYIKSKCLILKSEIVTREDILNYE